MFLLSAAWAACGASAGIRLWPGVSPNEKAGQYPPETTTPDDGTGCGASRNEKCNHVNDVSVPMLYPHIVNNGTGAAVLVAPGGGYHDLAYTKVRGPGGGGAAAADARRAQEGDDIARMYNAIGVSAFVLKYRVPARPKVPGLPKWWAPLQDAQRAMGIVRSRAAQWGIHPKKVGFTGFSAGGHLTAHISTVRRIPARAAWLGVRRGAAGLCGAHLCEGGRSRRRVVPPRLCAAHVPVGRGGQRDAGAAVVRTLRPPASAAADPLPRRRRALAEELNVTANHPPAFICSNEDDPTAPPPNTLGCDTSARAAPRCSPPTLAPQVLPEAPLCRRPRLHPQPVSARRARVRAVPGLLPVPRGVRLAPPRPALPPRSRVCTRMAVAGVGEAQFYVREAPSAPCTTSSSSCFWRPCSRCRRTSRARRARRARGGTRVLRDAHRPPPAPG